MESDEKTSDDGGNGTWARLSDGSWGVRAEPGLSGRTLTVRRKDGSTSRVTLGAADGGPGLYHVGSQVRAEARVVGGTRYCACGRSITGDYRTCYRCSPAGRAAYASAAAGCGETEGRYHHHRPCRSGGNCSSVGSGRSCGGCECDGY